VHEVGDPLVSKLCLLKPATPSKVSFRTMATASPTPIASSIPSSPRKSSAREPASASHLLRHREGARGRNSLPQQYRRAGSHFHRPLSRSAPHRLWVCRRSFYKNDKPAVRPAPCRFSSLRRAFHHGSGQRPPSSATATKLPASSPAPKLCACWKRANTSAWSPTCAPPAARRRSGPFLDFRHRPDLVDKVVIINRRYANEETVTTLRKIGALYLEKPSAWQDLINAVEKTMGKAR